MAKAVEHMTLADKAQRYFGLTLPVSRDVLKAKFRESAKRLHTDTSGADTKEEFLAMKAAYDELCSDKATGVFTDGPQELATVDGFPLSELGLGLGSLNNGRPCEDCKGKGYTERKTYDVVWIPLYKGIPSKPCYLCQACRSTLGCARCHGAYKHSEKQTLVEYRICAPCKGTGEIELFNPVIPKGLLASIRVRSSR